MALVDASNKVIFQLLKFAFGDPTLLGGGSRTKLYFTNAPQKLVVNDLTYVSAPSLAIEFSPNFSFVEDKPTKITGERTAGFFSDITSGEPFAEVDVTIIEAIYSADMIGAPDIKTMLVGKIGKAFRNYQQRANNILIEAIDQKALLDAPLGLIITHQCNEPFGKRKCKANVITHPITANTISGTRVIHLGTPIPDEFKPAYFIEGFMMRNNIRIKIKNWDGNFTFDLLRVPPKEWVGKEVYLYGGCDKTIEACREPIRNQEENFTGIGYAVPDANPLRPVTPL